MRANGAQPVNVLIERQPSGREKRLLQAAVAVAALVPVSAGLAGVVFGTAMIDLTPVAVSTDSHFRYLAGLLLAIGLAFWSTVPGIERKTGRFRLLAIIVAIGGCGRAVSLALVGAPSTPMLFALAMELVVTPLLALWQARVARRAAQGLRAPG